MQITVGSATHRGPRDTNEDALLCLPEAGLVAVADGMGGLLHGERMSAEAVGVVASFADELGRLANRAVDPDARRSFFEHLERVYAVAAARIGALADEAGAPCGTTLTTAVVAGGRLAIAHVGDSRAYRVRGAEVDLLTNDHSVAALRYRRGRISLEEYYADPMRSVLYEFLGQDSESVGEVVEADVEPGDVVVLCTDGVWDHVDPSALQSAARERDPGVAATQLVEQALALGSADNCTAVVAAVGATSDDRAPSAIVGKSELFGDLSPADLRMLSPYLTVRRVRGGERVFAEGDLGQELFLVGSGRVEVRRLGVPLVQLGPGSHFGEIAIATASPRSASVTAVQACELVVLDRGGLELLLRRRPGVGARVLERLLAFLGTRLVSMTDRAVSAELTKT